MSKGKVYLVGAGPGDPGLITVKAQELISKADVIVYDYLANSDLLKSARNDSEKIYVGKMAGFHSKPQEEIEAILVHHAKAGKTVVRLKGGDPFVFGRGGEEALTLSKNSIPFEIVPGVTAALAAAAYAGIPLSHRSHASSISFITGHEDPQKHELNVDFERFAKLGGTLCIYMGVGHIREIAQQLITGGCAKDTPVAVVRWATVPRQETLFGTLETIAEDIEKAGLKAPAIIFVGKTVGYSADLSWYDRKPLRGRKIAVTRGKDSLGKLKAKLEEKGADVIELPLIDIQPHIDNDTEADVFGEIWTYEWLVFTSANGVHHFFSRFFEKFSDIRSLGTVRIAAVGDKTAEAIRDYRISIDLIPEENTGKGLAEALRERESLDNLKVLTITGNRNRDDLVTILEEARAIVDTMQVYSTEFTDLAEEKGAKRFREEGADGIVFASSSAVDSFVRQAKSLALAQGSRKPIGFSLGPLTSQTMKEKGIPLAVEAKKPDMDALVEGICKYFNK